jgi:glyoxylase-like metal-dependent hydrolase (beta-lactamase superfamily II)
MILRQFLHSDPVAVSYLFGCGGRAAGAVVDPLGDLTPYLSDVPPAPPHAAQLRAANSGIDTHLHADHLSVGRALAQAAGAEYVLFAQAAANLPFRGVRDVMTAAE